MRAFDGPEILIVAARQTSVTATALARDTSQTGRPEVDFVAQSVSLLGQYIRRGGDHG
jgi:hypothetical protein